MADDQTTQPDDEQGADVTDAVEATAAEPSAPASLAAEADAADPVPEEAPVRDAEPAPDVEAEAAAAEAPPVDEAAAEAPQPEAETVPEQPLPEPAAEAETAPTEPEAPAGDPAADPDVAATPGEAAEPQGKKRSKKRLPRALRRTRSKPQREKPAGRRPIVRLAKPDRERGRRQERRGVVVSAAMDKTIVVLVETVKAHPRYKKVVRRSTKFHAHDEQNSAGVGDVVRIVETRPLSKLKSWRLAEVVEAAR